MDTIKAKQLAIELMNRHNLLGFWRFKWGIGKSLFGSCNFKTHIISISKPLTILNTENEVKDTILHEIAHVLAGVKAHHNQTWKNICYKIGARPHRNYPESVILPKKQYTATCPNCGDQTQYNIKRRLSCGKCSPRFNKKYILKFTKNERG